MILLIDIGNSNICFGLHDGNTIVSTYRIKTLLDKSSDEYYLLFNNFIKNPIEDVVIASVVPQVTSAIKKMAIKYYHKHPFIVGDNLKTGLKIIADDPKSVGADLVCDVLGATSFFEEGIIVDLGTASKVLYYKNNAFLGCIIAPGVSTSTKALISKTALLPNFELITPKKVLNNATIPCLQSGVLYGFASMVDGLIQRVKEELNNDSLKIIATGGLTSIVMPLCKEKIDAIEPNLVLFGLYKFYLKNKA